MPQAYPKVATHSNRRIRQRIRCYLIRSVVITFGLHALAWAVSPFFNPSSRFSHWRMKPDFLRPPPVYSPPEYDDMDDYSSMIEPAFEVNPVQCVRYVHGYPVDDWTEHFPFQRFKTTPSDTAVAACWPSYGGLWTKEITPLETDWLGLPTGASVDRGLDQAEEDAFCERLEKIGAPWYALPLQTTWRDHWESQGLFNLADIDIAKKVVPQIQAPIYDIALPSYGGVCIWREDMLQLDSLAKQPLPHYLTQGLASEVTVGMAESIRDSREYPHNWVRGFRPFRWFRREAEAAVKNAISMEDRCDAMLKYGGKYCAHREDCPDLARFFRDTEQLEGSCEAQPIN